MQKNFERVTSTESVSVPLNNRSGIIFLRVPATCFYKELEYIIPELNYL